MSAIMDIHSCNCMDVRARFCSVLLTEPARTAEHTGASLLANMVCTIKPDRIPYRISPFGGMTPLSRGRISHRNGGCPLRA